MTQIYGVELITICYGEVTLTSPPN